MPYTQRARPFGEKELRLSEADIDHLDEILGAAVRALAQFAQSRATGSVVGEPFDAADVAWVMSDVEQTRAHLRRIFPEDD